jgi:hypothetical protein
LIVLTVLLSFILLLMVFIPFVQQQIVTLAVKVPELADGWLQGLKPWLAEVGQKFGNAASPDDIKQKISEHFGDIFGWSLKIITNLLTNGMALANIISLMILTPIIMFYLLKDWPRFISNVHDMIPHSYRDTALLYAGRIDRTLSDYAKGQILVCLTLMILYSVALWIIGVKQPIFLGFMTGFMSFIPYVGVVLGLLATLANGFAHFDGWDQIILIFTVFVCVGLIEGNFLSLDLLENALVYTPFGLSLLYLRVRPGLDSLVFWLPYLLQLLLAWLSGQLLSGIKLLNTIWARLCNWPFLFQIKCLMIKTVCCLAPLTWMFGNGCRLGQIGRCLRLWFVVKRDVERPIWLSHCWGFMFHLITIANMIN